MGREPSPGIPRALMLSEWASVEHSRYDVKRRFIWVVTYRKPMLPRAMRFRAWGLARRVYRTNDVEVLVEAASNVGRSVLMSDGRDAVGLIVNLSLSRIFGLT